MTTEVTQVKQPTTLKGWVQSPNFALEVAKALPRQVSAERFQRVVLTAINKTPELANCDIPSVLQAVMDCASLGLEMNTPLGMAYVIPFGRKAQLIVGYRGLQELAYRSGKVRTIYAELVYENDEFDVELGLHRTLKHKPAKGDRGEVIHGYAVAHVDGCDPTFICMTAGEIDKIRKRSRSSNNGPWVTDWAEMAKKTCIRRLAKSLPMTPEIGEAITREDDSAVAVGAYADALSVIPTQAGEATMARVTSSTPGYPGDAPENEPPQEADPVKDLQEYLKDKVAELPRAQGVNFRQKVLAGVTINEVFEMDRLLAIKEALEGGKW